MEFSCEAWPNYEVSSPEDDSTMETSSNSSWGSPSPSPGHRRSVVMFATKDGKIKEVAPLLTRDPQDEPPKERERYQPIVEPISDDEESEVSSTVVDVDVPMDIETVSCDEMPIVSGSLGAGLPNVDVVPTPVSVSPQVGTSANVDTPRPKRSIRIPNRFTPELSGGRSRTRITKKNPCHLRKKLRLIPPVVDRTQVEVEVAEFLANLSLFPTQQVPESPREDRRSKIAPDAKYCFCATPIIEEDKELVLQCANDICPCEFFHPWCTGRKEDEPYPRTSWFCPRCRGGNESIPRCPNELQANLLAYNYFAEEE